MINISRRNPQSRQGATLVLLALLLPIFVGMVAFAVDIGHMFLVRSQLQTAADAGAVAGSLQLRLDDTDAGAAEAAAKDFVQRNRVGWLVTVPEDAINVQAGNWNSVTQTFTSGGSTFNSVSVDAEITGEPLSFAAVFGHTTFNVPRSAIATTGDEPMDIMLVLDLSGSMGSNGRIDALRDAVPTFVNVIEEIGDDDRIGVMGYGAIPGQYTPGGSGHIGYKYLSAPASLYPYNSTWCAVVEADLTFDFDYLRTSVFNNSVLTDNKYNGWTPIGAAIRDAAHYLSMNARSDIKRIMVLMSDGRANRPPGNGPGYAMEMANYASGLDIEIYTIVLGNGADETLMDNIANTTGGMYFDATGSGHSELAQRLSDAFRDIVSQLKRTQMVQ